MRNTNLKHSSEMPGGGILGRFLLHLQQVLIRRPSCKNSVMQSVTKLHLWNASASASLHAGNVFARILLAVYTATGPFSQHVFSGPNMILQPSSKTQHDTIQTRVYIYIYMTHTEKGGVHAYILAYINTYIALY